MLGGGLALLLVGGDALVRGAAALALRLRASHLVVGLVVGFGTSAPELFLALDAALQHAEALSIGTLLGSNVTNAFLVLGVQAVAVGRATRRPIGRDAALYLLIGTLSLAILATDWSLGRLDGLVLLVVFLAFLADQLLRARREEVLLEETAPPKKPLPLGAAIILAVIGLALLPVGAQIAVQGAVTIARQIGVSEAALGLTVTALGTSLPEIATAFAAGRRGHHAIGVGNVIGSNLFNGLAIAGSVALFRPISMPAELWLAALPAYLAAALVVFAAAQGWFALQRRTGVLLIALYIAYVVAIGTGAAS
jgi:cation:H+ antiporter